MRIRFLSSFRGLMLAEAVAILVLLSATSTLAVVVKNPTGGGQILGASAEKNGSIKQPTLYPRANYLWPFATGPFYGEVDESNWNSKGVMHLSVGSFDTRRGLPNIPQELRTVVKLDRQAAQYFLLQVDPASFADGSFDRLKQSVEAGGGAVMQSMPVAGFIVRLTPAAFSAVQGQPGVLFLEPYHPAFRISSYLGRVPLPDPVKALSSVYSVEILLFPGEDSKVIAQAVAGLGANVTAIWSDLVKADVSRDKIARIAALEPVAMIFEAIPNLPKSEETTTVVQQGHYTNGAIPYHDAGINGGGNGIAGTSAQVLMVLDSGIQLDAGDMSDTKTSAGTAGPTHRKVRLYTSTNTYGGSGDLLGCDAPQQGGFTHGEIVAATALGNGSATPVAYGGSWYWTDPYTWKQWKLDGVAPRAVVALYDANITASTTSCKDPAVSGINPGNLYTRGGAPGSGSLSDAYAIHGARVFNFSWGTQANPVYGTNATKVDQFLFDNKDAMLFVSAGNSALDTDSNAIPDNGSVSDPATAKNALVVGASDTANDGFLDTTKRRADFSSVGPATTASQRIAPVIMAPGGDIGGLGPGSEYVCRTNDNDQGNPVECDVTVNARGTSFAAAAAAGAALLVRDYFAQGFYPDGTSSNTLNAADQVSNVSGALLKAILIASGDFLNYPCYAGDPLCTIEETNPTRYRFNNEQGYGRIQLNNVLPLQTYTSPLGLVVADGGIVGGVNNTSFSGTAGAGTTEMYTFMISDITKELRIGLAWIEDASDALANDLDLELLAPSGRIYYGNYFTDDNNKNRQLDTGEDCAVAPWETAGNVDNSPWSLPTCANSARDTKNPTEAIFLSPHPDYTAGYGTPPDPDPKNQLEAGLWTLKVIGRTVPAGSQRYAVAMAGPVQLGSSVRLNVYRALGGADLPVGDLPTCNDKVKVVVNEYTDATDPTPTTSQVGARTVLQVIDKGIDGVFGTGDDVIVDQETNLPFTQDAGTLRYTSSLILLTDGTAPDPGNGALDVRDGQRIKVFYNDQTGGVVDSNKQRFNSTLVNCRAAILFGGIVFDLYGDNAQVSINGGCERDARGLFTFGYPDQYMDHGELVDFRIAVQTGDTTDLEDAVATLEAVYHDADSPESCLPNTTGCADPNRANNIAVASSILNVLDSPKKIGWIPAQYSPNVNQSAVPMFAVNFTIQMGAAISGKLDADMILGISARKAGKPIEGLAVYRTVLNANETALHYSTDFPTGGTQNYDWNNNEAIENPSTAVGSTDDYRFETVTWSDLTAGGTRNTGLQSPWNFDANDGGFRTGLNSGTNATAPGAIAQWGEDRNFNNTLDAGEDRDPVNSLLDQNWNTKGGCGWQTKGANATGGVWHTGRIDTTVQTSCAAAGATISQCQSYEKYTGVNGTSYVWELLETPVIEKVNRATDAEGRAVYRVQFTNWAWNMAIDMRDSLAAFTWEFDTDVDWIAPVSLETGSEFLYALYGRFGTISGGVSPLSYTYPVFADFSGTGVASSKNGTLGGNHEGKNPCNFERFASRSATYGFALPKDDDLRNGWCEATTVADRTWNKQTSCTPADQATVCLAPTYHGLCVFDSNASTDLYVYKNGPLRNWDLKVDGRYTTLGDLYGDAGTRFQGALGFVVFEGTANTQPANGYGVAIDDMVVEWKEIRTDEDTTTDCASTGSCATIDLATWPSFTSVARLDVTVTDRSPGNVAGVNDCNHDGDYTDAGIDDADCDDDGTADVPVFAYNDAEPAGEWVVLSQTGTTGVFKGSLPISSAYDSPGTLFVQKQGTSPGLVTVKYLDPNDGTGQPCKQSPDSAMWGQLQSSRNVYMSGLSVTVKSSRITNDAGKGDGDGFADTNETVNLFVTITNKSGVDLTHVVARLATNDPKIDCILRPAVTLASLAKQTTVEIPTPCVFHVASTANRAAGQESADFSARFAVTISSDQMDATLAAQEVVQDLDLDLTGGGTAGSYTEGFESGFGTFTSMTLDKGLNSNSLSNGMRCQYSDPDFVNANSYGETQCYLGFWGTFDQYNTYDWHVHGTGSPDGGRAYLGSNSLHWGYHQSASADNDTTHFSQMDAIRMNQPVNLGYTPVTPGNPEMSFKTQISFLDYRWVNARFMQAPDRGVVELQFADSAGTATGVWQKQYAYENGYDIQPSNNFVNCMFDPIDDGNNEDSYFSPTDPARKYGPSSTCYPEFNFSSIGDTDWRNKFIAGNTERASDDRIGLRGSIDRGTWVQSKFNLDRYRGRRARVRFLATTIKLGDSTDPLSSGWPAGIKYDDGWYIDDLQITNTLSAAATISADTRNNAALPACPGNCTTVTAALTSIPGGPLSAPGQAAELRADDSIADACLSGVLQYQYWIDANGNGILATTDGDTLARDWSDDSTYVDAPLSATQYGVKVRCSSAQSCIGQQVLNLAVNCPSTGAQRSLFDDTIGVNKASLGGVEPDNAVTVSWPTSRTFDAVRGDLIALRAAGGTTGFTGTVAACMADDTTATSIADATVLAAGAAQYYLVRTGGTAYCNSVLSYTTGAAKEKGSTLNPVTRDAQVSAGSVKCP